MCLSRIDMILISQILAKFNGQFLQLWFCSVRSPCITEAMYWSHPSHGAETELLWAETVLLWVTWSQYLQYLQSYLEIFISHLAAAVSLFEINNISLVCQYIIEIWPVSMACTWKNRDLLAAAREVQRIMWQLLAHAQKREHVCITGRYDVKDSRSQ